MKPPESNCHGCPDRTAECHGSCELYKQYTADLAAYNAAIKAAKKPNQVADEYAIHRRKRMKKERNHRERS